MPSRKNFMGAGPTAQEQQARRQSVEALLAPRLGQRRTASQDIPIARIQPNPFQARTTFDSVELEELAQAIRELGFTTRLRVRPHPQQEGFFQLVFGERRLRAAGLAGLETVPCDVAEHSNDDLVEIGLAENIQRRDLDPMEEAHAFQTVIDQRGYSIRRLAERLGKDKSYVEGRLALLRVPEDVQALVARRPDTLDAARQLAKLPLDERQPLIASLGEGAMTSREVRAFVRSMQDPASMGGAAARDDSVQHGGAAAQTAEHAPEPEQGAHGGGPRGLRTPDPHAALVRSVQRDRLAISAILKRWQTLRTNGAAQQAVVDEVLEAILVQISGILDAADHPQKKS